jgi:hypothetical protein
MFTRRAAGVMIALSSLSPGCGDEPTEPPQEFSLTVQHQGTALCDSPLWPKRRAECCAASRDRSGLSDQRGTLAGGALRRSFRIGESLLLEIPEDREAGGSRHPPLFVPRCGQRKLRL